MIVANNCYELVPCISDQHTIPRHFLKLNYYVWEKANLICQKCLSFDKLISKKLNDLFIIDGSLLELTSFDEWEHYRKVDYHQVLGLGVGAC